MGTREDAAREKKYRRDGIMAGQYNGAPMKVPARLSYATATYWSYVDGWKDGRELRGDDVTLTESQRKILAATPMFTDPTAGPGWIGQRVWGHTAPWRQTQAYAMTAGRILNQLRDFGLVQWGDHRYSTFRSGWRQTGKGQKVLKEGDDHAK